MSLQSDSTAAIAVARHRVSGRPASQGRLVWHRFLRRRLAVACCVLFLLIVVLALSSLGIGSWRGWWPLEYSHPYDVHNGGNPTLTLWPFSLGEHPFGQDRIGRDYFAMTMRGTQNTLIVMAVYGLLGPTIGIVIGSIAGYFRGTVDAVLMRITDLFIILPALMFAVLVGNAAGGYGAFTLSVMLSLFAWTGMARLIRGEVLTLRERPFVAAARVAGASDARIIFRHILPNATAVIAVSVTFSVAGAVLMETSLSFLGFGIKPPDVSLGALIAANQTAFEFSPWLYWWPASFIIALAFLVNIVGDGLRQAFDPRQRIFRLARLREPAGAGATGPALGRRS